MVTKDRFKVLFRRDARSPNVGAFKGVNFQWRLIVRDVVRRGVGQNARIKSVAAGRIMQVSQSVGAVSVRPMVQDGDLHRVYVFVVFALRHQGTRPFRVDRDLYAQRVRRPHHVPAGRVLVVNRGVSVLLFYFRCCLVF